MKSMTNDFNPTVSVIVPARNAARTVARTLDSVLAQTFPDWEAIVIDDGSSDETARRVEQAASLDPRIRLVAGPARGVSAARNAGLDEARGAFILFLDADDAIAPDHLARLVAATARHPAADVVYCDWRLVAPDGRRGDLIAPRISRAPFAALAVACAFPIHAALTRRTAINALDGFDETMRVCEDWDLWQRLARTGACFRHATGAVAEYWLNPGSLSTNVTAHLAGAVTVIRRGHGPDPRLRGADVLAAATEDGRAEAETSIMFWLLGRAIGAGGDGRDLLEQDRFTAARGFDPGRAAHTILDGIQQGRADPRPDWPSVWNGCRERLAAALAVLGPRFPLPGFADAVLYHADWLLARQRPSGETGQFGRVAAAVTRWDLPPADIVLPPGAERVSGHVMAGDNRIGTFEVAATGILTQARLEAIHRDFASAAAHGPAATAGAPADPALDDAFTLEADATSRRSDYWEKVFARSDPWLYDNPYERTKYAQTLAAIPGRPARALELACAEGHFTRELAPRVGRLLATDISPTAIERARARCAGIGNLDFQRLDLAHDPIPAGMDLILCSEVLYYVQDDDELARIADRIADALAPGGHLVMAHAHMCGDGPGGIGFMWGHPFGSARLAEVFGAARGLELVTDDVSALYRIQCYRRAARDGRATVRQTMIPIADEIPRFIAERICWAGRAPAACRQEPDGVPVLMYHRITDNPEPALARYATSPAAFRAQLDWLASEGYATVTAEDLARAAWDGAPMPARPVCITLDDAYLDNLTDALPALRDRKMTATVFVPTGHVGGCARWDQGYGEPARLMTRDQLAQWRDAGLALASHGRAHVPLPALSAADLREEIACSLQDLCDTLGLATACLAYPYGAHDESSARMLLDAGYRMAFTTRAGRWRSGTKVMEVPRLEVRGGMSIDAFAAMMRAD